MIAFEERHDLAINRDVAQRILALGREMFGGLDAHDALAPAETRPLEQIALFASEAAAEAEQERLVGFGVTGGEFSLRLREELPGVEATSVFRVLLRLALDVLERIFDRDRETFPDIFREQRFRQAQDRVDAGSV